MSGKHLILPLSIIAMLVIGCGSKEEADKSAEASPTPEEILKNTPETHGSEIKNVTVTSPLNQEWVTKGKATYEMKCLACHKLDGTRLVGPGWAGVSKRRNPVWIMNMITNVDMMLEKDEEAQKLLEQCLVRMPNQNITEPEAREVFEFMRHNDGEK
jgi:cytochrome c